MKVRKRSGDGKSLNMKVKEPLRVVAASKTSITLAMTLDAYDTEFTIELSRLEALDIGEKCKKFADSFEVEI